MTLDEYSKAIMNAIIGNRLRKEDQRDDDTEKPEEKIIDIDSLVNMELHDREYLGNGVEVMRVPNGWMYMVFDSYDYYGGKRFPPSVCFVHEAMLPNYKSIHEFGKLEIK